MDLGSELQRLQPMVFWSIASEPVVMQNVMAGSTRESRAAHFLVAWSREGGRDQGQSPSPNTPRTDFTFPASQQCHQIVYTSVH